MSEDVVEREVLRVEAFSAAELHSEDYEDAVTWLSSFTDFERSGRFQDRPDVAPMLELLERLGNPHVRRDTVHIAGSKGKGSVAAIIDAAVTECPIYVGRYTSPHLYSYCERIGGGGGQIAEGHFARLIRERLRPAVEAQIRESSERQLVTFDLLTALAFLHFDFCEDEIQVVEAGLGGRVDSTNVFENKEIVVITPISLEHTAILGDTVNQIATEKAAIITPGAKVILAPQPYDDAKSVVRQRADHVGAAVIEVAELYQWRKTSHAINGQRVEVGGPHGMVRTWLPLLGQHQLENAATAIATVDLLRRLNHCNEERLNETLPEGIAETRWPCRIEVVREDPLVIVDGAHNRDSARRLAETLVEYFACDRALFVIGCGADKDIDGLAEELAPLAARVIAVRADHPRAMVPERIAEAFGRLDVDSKIVDNVPNGVETALVATSDPKLTLICVAGSLFVAAEARAHVLGV